MTKQGQPFEFKRLPDGWWFGPISTIGRRICNDCRAWIAAKEMHWYRTGDGFICNGCEEKQRPHETMELCPTCGSWGIDNCETCDGVGYVLKQAHAAAAEDEGGAG